MQFVFQKKQPSSDAIIIQVTEEKTTDLYRDGEKGGALRIGIGKRSEMTRRGYFRLLRRIVREAQSRNLEQIRIELSSLTFSKLQIPSRELLELIGYHFEIAQFEFDTYRTEDRAERKKIRTVFLIGNATKTLQSALERGTLIAQEVNQARTLSNTPAGEMTPETLAAAAINAAQGTKKVRVTVLTPADMKKLKMGAILGVGQGSDSPPRFIVMEYKGAGKKPPVILVGKGVTFDSGGINIKSTSGLEDMHLDMSGAAVVMHAIIAAAKLELKKNIVTLIPAVENMPSGASYRPGDILKSMSGRTIEIGDTDAEGRVILADALTYAQKYKPKLIIDVATLTGAAEVALGQRACALFSNREHLLGPFIKHGDAIGDYVWPLPLWEEYDSDLKATFGDIANSHKTRLGGAIIGARFLNRFVENVPWVHIDMAPRMVAIDGDQLAKGSTGEPTHLLVKVLERM